jgi:hypothetical protein
MWSEQQEALLRRITQSCGFSIRMQSPRPGAPQAKGLICRTSFPNGPLRGESQMVSRSAHPSRVRKPYKRVYLLETTGCLDPATWLLWFSSPLGRGPTRSPFLPPTYHTIFSSRDGVHGLSYFVLSLLKALVLDVTVPLLAFGAWFVVHILLTDQNWKYRCGLREDVPYTIWKGAPLSVKAMAR